MQEPFPGRPLLARKLSVAFVLSPQFTLLAFSAFVDTLRLAADEGDRSRQILCHWTILSHDMRPIRSSCGVEVSPHSELQDPTQYDYVAVVGGLLDGPRPAAPLLEYLRHAASRGVPLIGICTGSFVLARLGLLENRRCCVSWFHHAEFVDAHPTLAASSDTLFAVDGDRLTCAGGTSVVHLASWLVEKHCGRAHATKALRILIEQAPLPADAPQPKPLVGQDTDEIRVRKAMLLIERNLATPLSTEFIARHVGVGIRQLERLFKAELGMAPSAWSLKLRLTHAHALLLQGREPVVDIALQCGFVNNSHFARRFRALFGATPSVVRQQASQSHARARPTSTKKDAAMLHSA